MRGGNLAQRRQTVGLLASDGSRPVISHSPAMNHSRPTPSMQNKDLLVDGVIPPAWTGRARRASLLARRKEAIRLAGSAIPFPAISKAVPWSGEVRIKGRPNVTLTA